MKPLKKKLTFIIALCVVFIDYFNISVVYPLFSVLLFSKEAVFLPVETPNILRGLYLGILLATEPLFHFLSTPIFGSLSDQKGRKKIISLCLIIGIFGYIVAVLGILLKSLLILIVSRIFIGISAGNASVVQASLADMSTKEEKSKNFGLFHMALGIGFTVGPFLGGLLSDPKIIPFASINLPFFFALGFICVNLLMVHLFFVETYTARKKEKFDIFLGIKVLKKGFLMEDLRGLFICAFIYVFGFSFFFEFISVYLIQVFQFTASDVGRFYAFASGVYAISSGFLIRPIVNRFNPKKVFFWALIFAGTGFFIAAFIESTKILYIYIAFVEFCIALLFPTVSTLVSNKVGEEVQGETLGMLQAVLASGFGLSPLFAGTLVGIYPLLPILIGGVCMLIAAVIFASIHFRKKKLHS